ncbi:hypothetical protein [Neogemmobacter tilapiae]|uniref:Translation initiation factor 2 n=1 Tax=Neogemmobacter tilapiae TaxID=875041 RepID=A0A918TXA1_9RHOB|nr:hypothetical protein [Gemmobacter tilapiae]GHC66946.1 hypothetical protein GCM10007315_34830 [Gemmobacter tilapiae]
MKPNFALNLTHERIELLHRNGRRWIEVGVASLDSPDLGEELATLRRTALGLSPSGFATKLILPESQILYDEVEAPGPGRELQQDQIRAALAGRTPYEVDELVFDWSGEGPMVKVAVVARETLDEAEQFAVQYKFNPVSFEARPDKAKFAGEPFFGPAAHAEVSLTAGETVEREAEEALAEAAPPAAEPAAEVIAETVEEPPVDVVAEELAAATMEAAPPSDDMVEAAAEIVLATAMLETPVPVAEEPSESATQTDAPIAAVVDMELPAAEPAAEAELENPVEAAPVEMVAETAVETPPAVEPEPEPLAPAEIEAEEAPVALDVEDEDQGTLTLTAPLEPEPQPEPVPQPPKAEEPPLVVPAFSSRRTVAESGAAPQAAPLGKTPPPLAGKPPALGGQRSSPAAAANAALGGNARVTAPGIPGLSPERRAKVTTSGPIADPRATPKGAAAVKRTGGFEGGLAGRPAAQRGKPRYLGLMLTGGLLLLLAVVAALSSFYLASNDETPSDTAVVSAEETVTTPEAVETEADAVETAALDEPAAIIEEPTPPADDPTALADVPAETTIEPEPRPEALAAAEPTTETPAPDATSEEGSLTASTADAPADAPEAEVDPEALADGQPEAEMTATPAPAETAASETPAEPVATETPVETATLEPTSETATPVEPAETPETATTVEPTATAEAPVETAAAESAVTEPVTTEPAPAGDQTTASERAAPVRLADGQDEIFLATADAPPAAAPALGLPGVDTATDGAPMAQVAPPPFGTVFQLGADGRIQPTPEGVVTPDGVTLIAGKPVKLPPPRPAAIGGSTVAAEPTDAAAAAGLVTLPTTEIAASDVFQADPTLAGTKPRARPEGLAPAPAAATPPETPVEGATPADDDAALDQPPGDTRLAGSRPRARPQEAFEIAAAAREASQAASLALVADGPISPLAVALSPRPAQKPDNFSKAVEAAVAAAVQEQPIQVAAAEPPPQEQAAASGLRVRKPKAEEGPERVEPEADDEPEAAPERRTARLTGTVEKKATFSNAYNLSKTGLIGVYGTASDRHALVRQSNGRFKKVKVGDRVEGGTVASITADELRYQKGGRMYALKMPKG